MRGHIGRGTATGSESRAAISVAVGPGLHYGRNVSEHSEFATPGQVQEHLERILPDEATRTACLSIFAELMERLHAQDPAHWGAYCEGDHLRLRGGGLIVLTIRNGRIWLALDQEAIDASKSAASDIHASGVEPDPRKWAHYQRPRTTNVFYAPSAESAPTWPLIKGLHFALLDRVARHALRPDSQEKHQPAISICLGALLRRSLPEPAYSSIPKLPVKPEILRELALPTADSDELERRVRSLAGIPFECPKGELQPRKVDAGPRPAYERRADVKAWVLRQAGGRCELCGCDAPFMRTDGTPYLELHHAVQLAEGGADTVENAVALCANCHRWLHHGVDRAERREYLYSQTPRVVPVSGPPRAPVCVANSAIDQLAADGSTQPA